ncbi:AAA family ATPase [Chryseobacterium indologenes]|uniref:AAA family ATPase n=1 Tax=Chryseobacterium indologenes TaxID=253 RepID=UPI0009A175EB|nr:AAA family ATPase [Chryseobacterium indologenes]
MRLVAIYLKDHFLFSDSILNLGGKYIYDVKYKQDNKYEITKVPNKNHIENFWGNNLSLVSAIVGENGSGKTSLFRNLNKIFSPYDRQDIASDSIFIFENLLEDSYCYFSEKFEIDEVAKIKKNEIETIYYSPVIDYDLIDINSPISMIQFYGESISTFYIQNIQRHLFFLKNTNLLESLKKSYEHFPFYEKLTIKANQLYRDDFERVYIHTTIGNNFYRVRNDLMQLAKNTPYCFSNENEVEEYFNRREGLQEELRNVWSKYKNSEESSHLLHDGKDFKKNLEINILSFLVINDTFTINNDNGSYDFNKILEPENFTEKLHHFFNKYIIQTSKYFYQVLLKGKNELDIEDSEILLKELTENNSLKDGTFPGGFKIDSINRVIKNHILIFRNILDFYNQINQLINDKSTTEIEGGLEIDITKLDLESFNKFIKTYEFLKDELTDSLPNKSRDILEIKPTKKLSTGEKALLDLYSSIYDYLKRFGDHQYNENCIFLLDEADLGFHPEWKKKYINALTTTLPILISSVKDKIKNLQIVFATHDPLTLSDIPNRNVAYLKRGIKTEVLSENEKPTKSFGANITDLLSDSFFIRDGLMGDFAKEKIEEVIKYLNGNTSLITDNVEAKKIINIIDEPILKYKLEDMYFEKFPEEYNKEKEIEELMKKAQELGLNIQR